MHRSALGAALLTTVLLIAACTAATSQAPGESEEAAPSSEASSSEESQAPAETPGNGNGGGELEAILPDEVDGIAMQYEFAGGASAMGSEGVPPEAQAFFDRLGADINDITTGFGFAFDQADPENPRIISIFAMRVAGADEGRLRDAFRSVLEDEGNVFTEANVGGKNVLAFTTDGSEDSSYLYVKSDIVFMVGGAPIELAGEALSALP